MTTILQRAARRFCALELAFAARTPDRDGSGGFHRTGDDPGNAQKNQLKPWLKKMWCIPPVESARFVAAMEEVLSVYERPLDAKRPLVCLDEAAKQILGHTRPPLPMAPAPAQRFDNEYERRGTCSLFLVFEPLLGHREVIVTERRTALDYAQVVRHLCDQVHPEAEKIVLVQDNLNTHGPWSLYQAFAPEEARRLSEHIEWHYTPKHGSWLNMAEIELSVLARQCLQERMESQQHIEEQVQAWQHARNAHHVKVEWHFGVQDARCKLKRLYPKILPG